MKPIIRVTINSDGTKDTLRQCNILKVYLGHHSVRQLSVHVFVSPVSKRSENGNKVALFICNGRLSQLSQHLYMKYSDINYIIARVKAYASN